ncbi:vitamin B6 photo-protection and homoeostasis-domain-containing protein [Flagelloscypha sp. PMI_526]|nr:vitamin B6 photo-protection and homoeostasis-domain-containing protein [Flagelloscypha sp. PMI_526]
MSLEFVERADTSFRRVALSSTGMKVQTDKTSQTWMRTSSIKTMLSRVFLPEGYPDTVSPDYTRYQIMNGLQAFCSGLAGLIASRAVLEGYGVGNANASATQALILSILQDVASRLTTIYAGYHFGPLLAPEAKTYRFFADVVNDVALTFEVLSPLFTSPSAQLTSSRMAIICAVGCSRSLCAATAGGSRSAITVHFANVKGGDIGDLSAKDGSKETVLSLIGVLLGSVLVPMLTTRSRTYPVFVVLIFFHLLTNYIGVKGPSNSQPQPHQQPLQPNVIGPLEHIFAPPSVIRDHAGRKVGKCFVGASFSHCVRHSNVKDLKHVINIFADEKFILWRKDSHSSTIHLVLKEGYTEVDVLKGWCWACEILVGPSTKELDQRERMNSMFVKYMDALRTAGWNVEMPKVLCGSPDSVLVRFEHGKKEA